MSRRTARRFILLALVTAAIGLGVSPVGPRAQTPTGDPPPAFRPQQGSPPTRPFLDRNEPRQDPGIDLGEPAFDTESGPLFGLRAITERLGGDLAEGRGSFTLTLGDTRIVFGPGNPVMIVGRDIVELSQPPLAGEDGRLLVPLDFLRATFGRLADYTLTWQPAERRLTAARQRTLELPVAIDVVHLQGVSTVVLQFPQRVEYQVRRRSGRVEVTVSRHQLVAATGGAVDDPLVERVRVGRERVLIELVPGANAEGYALENPFRLVFDVVRRDGAEEIADADAPDLEPPKPQPGIRTIVIDPGHGGSESGAVSEGGLQEKDLTLALAQALRSRLVERLPVRVVLTRTEDAHLPLDTRAAIANQNKADLFVSIHLNSSLGPDAHGAETYFLSLEASDARSARRAEAENTPPVTGGDDSALYDLQLILWDLAQTRHLAESQRVAGLIQNELNSTLGLRDRGVKQAPFRVLMGAAMPAVLVELGFLSNPDEEARLRDAAYRGQLVDALVEAIGRYREEVEGAAAAADNATEAAGAAEETGE